MFQALAGLVGAAALALQYYLLLDRLGGDALAATLRFFSYFTLLSNSFGTAALLLAAFAPVSPVGQFFLKPAVRTAAALYLIIVGVVYHIILASQWEPKGLQLVADIILHSVMPAAMCIDWLSLTPKHGLRFSMIPPWLLMPLGFGAWALTLGAFTGFYPYSFIDAGALGYGRVALNMGFLIGAFALTGALLIIVGRIVPGPKG
ncbi:MAG: Pr6Pr family membrane protein [Parvularculaceae bacterium]